MKRNSLTGSMVVAEVGVCTNEARSTTL